MLQLRVDAECADLVPSLRMTLPTEKQMGRQAQSGRAQGRAHRRTDKLIASEWNGEARTVAEGGERRASLHGQVAKASLLVHVGQGN